MTLTTNDTDAPSTPAPSKGARRALAGVLRIVVVRLRFLIVLAVAVAIVSQWHALAYHWDGLINMFAGGNVVPAGGAISSETEFFCPMDPGVLSDWPTKCPICNMALVRRRKGEAEQLPDGVVARMQFSPYRVQLAGIRTSRLDYRPLAREIVTQGVVAKAAQMRPVAKDPGSATGDDSGLVVDVTIHEREIPFVSRGQVVELTSEAFAGREPWKGTVESVRPELSPERRATTARVAVETPHRELWPGMRVRARLWRAIADIEPFCSQPSDLPPVSSADPRRVFVCPDHPQVVELRAGRCPHDDNELDERPLADHQRVGWWCPMHPALTAGEPGHECDECGGMKLRARVVNYRPLGEVLAVPQTAVVDTGERKLVYIESMPGMFDGVEVEVGPRCGDFYPVVYGLEAGQRVATAGAFLIDAETRLNPSLAASYFGAARGSITGGPEGADGAAGAAQPADGQAEKIRRGLAELSPADRALALRQKVCPVTGLPLGSMGAPERVVVNGQTIFICCEGCAETIKNEPAKYFKKTP